MNNLAPTPEHAGAAPPPPADDLPKRSALYRLGKRLRPWFDRLIQSHSEAPDAPVLSSAQFPWTRVLEANWELIRAEAETALAELNRIPPLRDISPDHRRIAEPDNWRSYFLWGYGYRMDENCLACPETDRLLAQVTGLNSAFFSILKPGAHIPRHRGPTKALLTCHLGLFTPKQGRCRMQVGDELVGWADGKTLVFDDTYPHEVWNDTQELRIILLVQFRRPVRPPGKWVADLFMWGIRHSPFVQEGRRNLAKWSAARW
jgi:beta-hydroxylase